MHDEVHAPTLDRATVVSLAETALLRRGYDMARFHAPDAAFERGQDDCTWHVHYWNRDEVIGGHVSVVVDDRTGKAEVFGGE